MEIRASFDAATLNLAANVAKSDGESAWGGGGGNQIGAGVRIQKRQFKKYGQCSQVYLFDWFADRWLYVWTTAQQITVDLVT